VKSQICHGISQNDPCSSNGACGCLQIVGAAADTGICGFLYGVCSELVSCGISNNFCYDPNTICVHHLRCFSRPTCYPKSMTGQRTCPPIPSKRIGSDLKSQVTLKSFLKILLHHKLLTYATALKKMYFRKPFFTLEKLFKDFRVSQKTHIGFRKNSC
jgi:hypothetical protein